MNAFTAAMIGEGYAPYTLKTKFDLVSDLSAWLEHRALSLTALSERRLGSFYAQRHCLIRQQEASPHNVDHRVPAAGREAKDAKVGTVAAH
jgi:hypothetical protein